MEELLNTIYISIKIFSGIISWIMFVLIIFFAIKTDFYQKKIYNIFIGFRRPPKANLEKPAYKVTAQWQAIQQRILAEDEANHKLAVIEADKLLDTVLKNLQIPGQTMADRLKMVPSGLIPSLDSVWQVHKLRNHLVHNSDFKLSHNKTKQAMAIYEQAFKELKVI